MAVVAHYSKALRAPYYRLLCCNLYSANW